MKFLGPSRCFMSYEVHARQCQRCSLRHDHRVCLKKHLKSAMSSKHRSTLHLHVYLFVSSRVLISILFENEKRDRKTKSSGNLILIKLVSREKNIKRFTRWSRKDVEQI